MLCKAPQTLAKATTVPCAKIGCLSFCPREAGEVARAIARDEGGTNFSLFYSNGFMGVMGENPVVLLNVII